MTCGRTSPSGHGQQDGYRKKWPTILDRSPSKGCRLFKPLFPLLRSAGSKSNRNSTASKGRQGPFLPQFPLVASEPYVLPRFIWRPFLGQAKGSISLYTTLVHLLKLNE